MNQKVEKFINVTKILSFLVKSHKEKDRELLENPRVVEFMRLAFKKGETYALDQIDIEELIQNLKS